MAERFIQISPVFGCLDELRELVDLLPTDARIRLTGNYADLGPFPLETLEWISDLKQRRPDTQLLRGIHEEFLMIAAGLIPELPHLKFAWSNPYHGTLETIAAYGIDALEWLAEGKEQSIEFKAKLRARGHEQFLMELTKPSETITAHANTDCVFGGKLHAIDLATQRQWSVQAKRNYFSEFVGRTHRKLSDHIYGGRFPVDLRGRS